MDKKKLRKAIGEAGIMTLFVFGSINSFISVIAMLGCIVTGHGWLLLITGPWCLGSIFGTTALYYYIYE